MRRAVEFCTTTKATIDDETNEAVRRHYRRPPTLQSQVYELRLREVCNGGTLIRLVQAKPPKVKVPKRRCFGSGQ